MKKPPRLGLVVEGKLTNSAILRSPPILAQLGPVKARTLRVARRTTNFLRAGTPTDSYEAFEEAQLILIHVPPESVQGTVEELAQAPLTHAAKGFTLCETWSPSSVLAALAARGAGVATAIAIPTEANSWFVLEGSVGAVRAMRAALESGPDRVLSLREGTKERLFAAELLAGVLPLALFARAEEALRSANVAGRHLRTLLDGIAQRMLLDNAHAGRATVRSPLRDCPVDVARSQFQILGQTNPQLATFLRQRMASAPVSELLPQFAKLEEDDEATFLEAEGT